ncbi:MAG: 6-phosphogluconate dehydrogenase (decarboxylating) [Woeseia sp.]|nr:6-phosphogluconate dehydrogenase (decarboxylating) [Woeseia sp.]
MQIGMIGLGRMGASMVQRLLLDGHDCVVNDRSDAAIRRMVADGAKPAETLNDLVQLLQPPRAVWIMLPENIVDEVINDLANLLDKGDTVIDGGNSNFLEDARRAESLKAKGLHYIDVGTSGGVWGRERGYCLMIGGEHEAVDRLTPVFRTLAPGEQAASQTDGRKNDQSTAHEGYLHCGGHGAGHFTKMVHNAIEYSVMAAYGEGFAMLDKVNGEPVNRHPSLEKLQVDADVGEVAELWRRGSVIGSWLLDLSAESLQADPQLEQFSAEVSDSGEGRWAVNTAVNLGIPAHVFSAALFNRFSSRKETVYANKLQSALRYAFGGHNEKPE